MPQKNPHLKWGFFFFADLGYRLTTRFPRKENSIRMDRCFQ